MEAICSSETSAATEQTTRRRIPEDDTFLNRRCENLKSSMYLFVCELFNNLVIYSTYKSSFAHKRTGDNIKTCLQVKIIK
jgi:hypothetical protein